MLLKASHPKGSYTPYLQQGIFALGVQVPCFLKIGFHETDPGTNLVSRFGYREVLLSENGDYHIIINVVFPPFLLVLPLVVQFLEHLQPS